MSWEDHPFIVVATVTLLIWIAIAFLVWAVLYHLNAMGILP